MTTRAVLYARVSSDDRGKDRRNLTGQLEMCREYAQEHGYTVVAELAEDDRGASGAEINLPELNRIRDMAQAGEFDVLIVREIDRLSRNLAKQLIVEQELKRDGVVIEYVMGEYPDTPEGNLQKHVKAAVAEYEREKITERSKRGRRQKVRAGNVILGGRPPYGYRVADVEEAELVIYDLDNTPRREKREPGDGLTTGKRVLVVYEPEARIVQLIFEWYTKSNNGTRMGLGAIARKLSEMTIPTMGDISQKIAKSASYGRWGMNTIAQILHNETYCGRWFYGKTTRVNGKTIKKPRETWLLVEVPSIIDCETWKLAQDAAKENLITAKRNVKHTYLLRGRVVCNECGLAMGAVSRRENLKYYRCNPGNRPYVYSRPCGMRKHFRADAVDLVVWQWVKSFLTAPSTLTDALRAQQEKREEDNKPLHNRLAVIDDLLADNKHQMERLLDLYLVGDFPKEVLTERKVRIQATIDALEGERAALVAQLDTHTITDGQIENIVSYTRLVADGIEVADTDFNKRRWLIVTLDVRARLAVENGEQMVYVQCLLSESDCHLLPIRQSGR